MSRPYWLAKREPWQPCCDRCGATLVAPFYWGEHKQYQTICSACHDIWEAKRLLAIQMNSPEHPDPRYA